MENRETNNSNKNVLLESEGGSKRLVGIISIVGGALFILLLLLLSFNFSSNANSKEKDVALIKISLCLMPMKIQITKTHLSKTMILQK